MLGVFARCHLITWQLRFASASSQKPGKESTDRVNDIIKSLSRAKPAESSDIIEFLTPGGFTTKPWKGKLAGDVGVFASGDDAYFLRRDEVAFVSKEKKPKKRLKVSIQLGQQKFAGVMSQESMQRYEVWKQPQPGLAGSI